MADQLLDGIKLNAYEHSITKKTFTTYSMTDTQYEDEFPSMNPSRPILKPEFFNNLDGGVIYKSGDGIYSSDTKGKFNESLVREMGRTKIIFSQATIRISGNANLDVGDVINLRFTDTAGEESTFNSGKWVISQMKHTVNLSEYSQTCTIIKGSYKQITKEIQE